MEMEQAHKEMDPGLEEDKEVVNKSEGIRKGNQITL